MKVTEEAISQLKQIIANQDSPGIGVRIYTSSGCCGPNLHMSIVDQLEKGDKVLNISDLDFMIEDEAEDLITDLVVDFTDEKFRFLSGKQNNCGC